MIRVAILEDVDKIHSLINGVELERASFIKSTKEEIQELVVRNQSFVFDTTLEIVGVLLMKDNYIDTVVSTQNGVGKALIKNLSAGRYKANKAKR
jgi:N-acetylglutamate synthase-like GNAT family acetyltransferase